MRDSETPPQPFPLQLNERDCLYALKDGPKPKPRGTGIVTTNNLESRGWIILNRHEFGVQYVITQIGLKALMLDEKAINQGLSRPARHARGLPASVYADLDSAEQALSPAN